MNKLVPLEKYKDFMTNFPICAVDVLLLDGKENTLLFKRNNEPYKGEYFTLGGRLLKNEVPIDCAIRKLDDEVGIKVNKNQLKFIGIVNEINPNSIFPKVNYHALVLLYALIVNSKEIEIKLDSQHSDYKWFNIVDENINGQIKLRLKIYKESK